MTTFQRGSEIQASSEFQALVAFAAALRGQTVAQAQAAVTAAGYTNGAQMTAPMASSRMPATTRR